MIIATAYIGSITLQIKDETLLEIQQSTEDLKHEIDLLLKKVEYQKQYIDQLQHMLLEARRHRFCVKSERFDHPFQESFDFGQNNSEFQKNPNELPETLAPAHKRKKKSKSNKVLPRRIIIIPVAQRDKQCACGKQMNFIRYKFTEKLDYKPTIFEIVEEQRKVLACPQECEKSMVTANAPKRILPKVPVTENLLAHVIISKFDDRQPLYHVEKQFLQDMI